MTIKKFIAKTLLFSIFSSIIYFLPMFVFPFPDMGYREKYKQKRELILEAASPKIIFVGGSNLAFGLNSKLISEQYKLPVCNMGMNAGMGLYFMINDILPIVEKGDYIIISPEYTQFKEDTFYGEDILFHVIFCSRYWSGLKRIKRHKLLPYLYLARKFWIDRKNEYKSSPAYSKDAYNEFGDVDKHWELPSKRNITPEKYQPYNISTELLYDLTRLCNKLKSKGCIVIFLPPPYQKSSYLNTEPNILLIKETLKKNGFCREYDTEKYCFDDSLFYDTTYHLNKKGVNLRTKLVIDDLRPYVEHKINN